LTLGPRWTALLAAVSGSAAAVVSAFVVPPVLVVVIGSTFILAFPSLLARPGLAPAQAARLRVAHRWCCVAVGAVVYVGWRSAT
jgi:hypothetical protein